MTVELFDAVLPHGITLSCRRAGPAGVTHAPRLMFLHGFPEAAFVWDEVMLALAPALRSVAPNLRGYERSSAPTDVAAYRAKHLVADIVALVEQTGGPLDLLVAHDWGGAVAWNLAAQYPQIMKRLLIINSPHPATFLRELRDNAEQQAASAYMTFLCRPDAEGLLAANDFARIWPFLHNPHGAAWLTPEVKDQYRQVWSAGLTGALNFYRASPLRPPSGAPRPAEAGRPPRGLSKVAEPHLLKPAHDAIHTLQLPDVMVTARVPTTVIWGEADIALRPGLLDGIERWVPDLALRRIPGASHWIVHEQPALIVAEIQRALAA